MFTEDELLPISALQHLLFCERQCALIHIEQVWAENRFTVEGQHLHKKAHQATVQERHGVRIARALVLRSHRLGLIGKADVVEFIELDASVQGPWPQRDSPQQHAAQDMPRTAAKGSIVPIEYKRGKPKTNDSDRVQLCAQAICLEEMLGAEIPRGAIFYGRRRRRTEVLFDQPLRDLTASVARRLHDLIASGRTPPAYREPKCDHCSLLPLCMPGQVSESRPISSQIDRAFRQHLASVGPQSDKSPAEALSRP